MISLNEIVDVFQRHFLNGRSASGDLWRPSIVMLFTSILQCIPEKLIRPESSFPALEPTGIEGWDLLPNNVELMENKSLLTMMSSILRVLSRAETVDIILLLEKYHWALQKSVFLEDKLDSTSMLSPIWAEVAMSYGTALDKTGNLKGVRIVQQASLSTP